MRVQQTLGFAFTIRVERTVSEPALNCSGKVTKNKCCSRIIRTMVGMGTILTEAYKVDFK
jgi:hypothetical protein